MAAADPSRATSDLQLEVAMIRDAINAGLDVANTKRDAFQCFASYVLIWIGVRAVVELHIDGETFTSRAELDSAPENRLDSRKGDGFCLNIMVEEELEVKSRFQTLFPNSSNTLEQVVGRIRALARDTRQAVPYRVSGNSIPDGDWWLHSLLPLQENLERALNPFTTSALCRGSTRDEQRLQLWCVLRHFWHNQPRELEDGSSLAYTASLLPTSHQLATFAHDNNYSSDEAAEIISTPVGRYSRSTADTVFQSSHLLIGQPSGASTAPNDQGPPSDSFSSDYQRRVKEYQFYRKHCGYTERSRIAYFPGLATYGLLPTDMDEPIFALYFFLTETSSGTRTYPDAGYTAYRFWRDMAPIIGERLRAAYEDAYVTVVLKTILDRYHELPQHNVIEEVNTKLQLLTRLYALPRVSLRNSGTGVLIPTLSRNVYYCCASDVGHMKSYYGRLKTQVESTLERANVIASDATLNGQLALSHTVYNIVALSQLTSLGRSINELPDVHNAIKKEFARSEVFFDLLSGCAALSEGIAAPSNDSKYITTEPYSLFECLNLACSAVELKHPGFKIDLSVDGDDILIPAGFIKNKATSSVLFEILENVIQEARFEGVSVPVLVKFDQSVSKICIIIQNRSKHNGRYCLSSSGIWIPEEGGESQRLSYLRRMRIAGPKIGILIDTDFNEETRIYSTTVVLKSGEVNVEEPRK